MRKGGHLEYATIVQSLTKIIGEEGFLALYKGLVPTLVGLLHVAIQFPLYEALCTRLVDHSGPVNTIVIASSVSKVRQTVPPSCEAGRFQVHNPAQLSRSWSRGARSLPGCC